MSAHSAAPRAGSARPAALASGPLARMAEGTLAMAQAEMSKLRHDHLDIVTRSVQPLLWLFIFGSALQHNKALSLDTGDYRAYLAPGVMAQAAMFIAIFYGLSVIWERDVGQLQRLLATPLSRSSIVLGKAAGACTRALVQAALLLVVLAATGIGVQLERRRRARHAHAARPRHRRPSPACRCCSPPSSRSASASWASAS